eukprot:3779406-Prymnesium_polylepis.1
MCIRDSVAAVASPPSRHRAVAPASPCSLALLTTRPLTSRPAGCRPPLPAPRRRPRLRAAGRCSPCTPGKAGHVGGWATR